MKLILLSFFCLAVTWQGFAFGAGSVQWRSLGQDEGFTGGAVSSIIQDRQGFVWIAAAGGLYRYDGHNFKTLKPDPGLNSLTSSSISAVIEDRKGNLWVGTDGGGLAHYDTIAGRFEKIRLSTLNNSERYGGNPGDRISALARDGSGRILIGSADGSVRSMDPEDGEATPSLIRGSDRREVTSLFVDSKGVIWVGTDGAGLLAFDEEGKPAATFVHDRGDQGSIASDRVSAIIEDSLGFLWIGFADGGIDLFEEGRFRHAKSEATDASPLPPVTTLAEDVKGQIWAGFHGSSLGILDPSSMETIISPFVEGKEVRFLFRDRRGLMWAGLSRGGLRTGDLRSATFSRYSMSREGRVMDSISAIAELPSGALVAASRTAGIIAFDPLADAFSAVRLRAGVIDPGNLRDVLATKDGSLWVGTSGSGLLRRSSDGSISRFRHEEGNPGSLASSSVLSLLEAGWGRLWVGTDGEGLDLFDPAKGEAQHWGMGGDLPALLPASIITCLLRDSKNRVWAGSADAGLFVLDPGGTHFRPVGRNERRAEGIGDLRIESIFEDSSGTLWVGTGGGGLVALDLDTGAVIRRGSSMGLFADAVYAITEDAAGILWILSSAGLFSLDPARNDVFLFGREDGLNGGGLDAGAILFSKGGELWVGSGEGLARFDPARIARYASAPDVVLSEIEPMGEGSSMVRSADGTGVILDYDNLGLGFSIAAMDFAAPSRNRYAMRLEGRQSSWTQMGNVNTGYIAPLAPGRYMLRVRAANGNGIWNDYGASLSILVQPPWWGTWWFRTFVLGTAAVGLAAAIAARVGSLRRRNALLVKFARHIEEAREEERTIAARDVHDEIGQHLMVLNFHAYWLASHADAKPAERLPIVKEMQKAILDAMASVKAVATRLRPQALDTLDFADALRWYVRSFGRMSGITTKLEMDEGWKELPRGVAKAFFRLLQEMLSNVARHSGAKQVFVRFASEGDDFILETKDDGKGIDPGKVDAQDSFGIMGMREGCVSLGGSLVITGAPGRGCTVAARLPRKRGIANPGQGG